ncbi:type VI secretion system accessory protein TagJ [Hyalangium rubrum]|uniref:Type VI secretion system accessory protein TagJ n=1 Tax=Hyalangium rubrum TaxID=3103134 RepID=A0ABU5HHM7_9BACT|nr:type VI secretion system accessory protein TagJ [Hyalangium sp. s54d21]MDY7232968.1 type VI secretion system accessory protein TagJ [Hyalangium sp. s54d21]
MGMDAVERSCCHGGLHASLGATTETVEQLIQKGDFVGALRALEAELQAQPAPEKYLLVFNLRTRLEDYDGALAALEQVVRLMPDFAEGAGFLRDCAEAERLRTLRGKDAALAGARKMLGGMPPPASMRLAQAAVFHAQGRYAEAARTLTEAKEAGPAVSGTLTRTNGAVVRFTDLTDSDELTGRHLPCFEGRTLLDVPYSELREVRFAPPRSFMESAWLPALLVPRSGEPVPLRVFTFYAGTGRHESEQVRMGGMTFWEHGHGYAEGVGQRDFKVTHEDGTTGLVGVLQVAQIVFDAPSAPQVKGEEEKPQRKGFWSRLFG